MKGYQFDRNSGLDVRSIRHRGKAVETWAQHRSILEGGLGDRLTKADPKTEERLARTPHGYAGWTGEGPPGRSCSECAFFLTNSEVQFGRCAKLITMTADSRGRRGLIWFTEETAPKFPASTSACPFFKEGR
jgi:hypothetical protein